MSVSSRALVETVLLGPMNDRRQLQNSPILGDVWIAFASKPTAPLDLLITPYKERSAGPVAVEISKRVEKLGSDRQPGQEAQVAYLDGLVAARLFFREVFRVILPMTKWWQELRQEWRNEIKRKPSKRKPIKQPPNIQQPNPKTIEAIIKFVHSDDEDTQIKFAEALSAFPGLDRYFALAGIILWAASQSNKAGKSDGVVSLLADVKGSDVIVEELDQLFKNVLQDNSFPQEPQIWQVSLNRKAMPALERSVPAVKGDAARSLFNVNCENIAWAVIDSGIDGRHEAFKDKNGKSSRIIKAFDFSNIRKIISLDNRDSKMPGFKQRFDELWKGQRDKFKDANEARRDLKELAEDAYKDRPINWRLVEKFIEISPKEGLNDRHGTHVAGIIGAKRSSVTSARGETKSKYADGMCPDINLYDFRVLSKSLKETEFAIIAALQYIRYLNERHGYMTIHGANLSLSIPHDVRNFACGSTPICNECERLVESGVVVVAAAGNLGYQRFETMDGSYEGYTAFSITDPGNADGVITVGATHRYRPHTYGVSFFSSRGPTGDGRMKPDLVAPGERIESCLPQNEWGELDGTSMAAPHVSGAAAMLMARYAELIGDPRRIKRILCESATDLGRERSFQGYGMLDVLRAFQKI